MAEGKEPTERTYLFTRPNSARSVNKNSDDEEEIEQLSGDEQGNSPKISDQNFLSGAYESLNYDVVENELHQEEQRKKSIKEVVRIEFLRWLVMFFVGVLTGLVACLIDVLVVKTTDFKFSIVKKYIDQCVEESCLEYPFMIWIAINCALVFFGSLLTAFIEPVAAGSGIPQIKCFLNGVKVPHVVRLKTIICKVVGVICAVGGGLYVGKEGPMIHSGAVIAAGISQGKSNSLNLDFKLFEFFRSDKEKRDFVSGGAAAGVSAAFGAPVGGVLFSLEEGASFWNQALTWRIFFASMISTFTLNIVQSYVKDQPWDLSSPGLFNFGTFDTKKYSAFEIPIFILMGVVGGLLGALFNQINYKLTKFRRKYITKKWMQVLEAMMVAGITGTVSYVFLYFINNCGPVRSDLSDNSVQFFCNDGEYSNTASILFQTPEDSVKHLFHDVKGVYKPTTLIVYCVCCFLLACWTYGLYVPSGLFIPGLLVGAAWGRAFGIFLNVLFPNASWVKYDKYAMIGAAAQLGGIVRMTISLTVIVVEATGNITFVLPIMIVLMVAKWVGDVFNEGIYDMHIHLQGVPILGWEPSEIMSNVSAKEVMSHPVTVFRKVESVGRIFDILKQENHNGFPVVTDFDPFIEQSHEGNAETFGTFEGMILRSQLLVLLKLKAFEENDDILDTRAKLRTKDFRDAYPRFTPIHLIHITPNERDFHIDLSPFMNPAAYTVTDSASFPRIFQLFRALGLRHLVVVNNRHNVIGMVTRKDLARYKVSRHLGSLKVEELLISSK